MNKRRMLILICIILISVATIGTGFGIEKSNGQQNKTFESLELFSDSISIIEAHYVGEVKMKDLMYGAMDGMLSSLDPYSQFLTPDEYKDMQVQAEGEFGGLGIKISIKDNILTVITPLHGTPADKAGIEAGDRIIKIDDESTEDITLLEAVKKLRGKPGTEVTLTIFREEEAGIFDVTITRDIIAVESLKGAQIIEDGIGYVKLIELQEDTPDEFKKAVNNLNKENMSSFILDLRNNPGGLLSSAIEVSDMLLNEEGVIVSTKARSEEESQVFKTREKSLIPDTIPIVVMINEGSASGAEIIAGALQDYNRAVLLGAKTFGKGSVQTIIPLNDGSALRMTTSKYYLPSGRSIHEIGIMPDVIVRKERQKDKNQERPELIFEEMDKQQSKEPLEEEIELDDYQLQRAIDLIKGLNVYSKRYSKQSK
jgi:carboxyl-terminal processing protease